MAHLDDCPTCGRPFPGIRIHLSRRMVRRLQHLVRYGPQEQDGKSIDVRLYAYGFIRLVPGEPDSRTECTDAGRAFICDGTVAPKYLVVDTTDGKPPTPATRMVGVVEVMGDAMLDPDGPVGEPTAVPA